MIYVADTVKCDDPACHICVGLCEDGRDFGHNRCQQCGLVDCDLMMIHTALWRRIAEDPELLLCPGCMDRRLVRLRGFGIVPEDLTDCPINYLLWPELMARQERRAWDGRLSDPMAAGPVQARASRPAALTPTALT